RIGEDPGALEDDVDAEIAPRQRGRVLLGEDPDLAAVDDDRLVAGSDVAVVGAVRRVVLEEQGVHLGVDQIGDGDHLDGRGAFDERLERLATDPPEAVDTDTGGHGSDLLGVMHATGRCRTRDLSVSRKAIDGAARVPLVPDRLSAASYQRRSGVPEGPKGPI